LRPHFGTRGRLPFAIERWSSFPISPRGLDNAEGDADFRNALAIDQTDFSRACRRRANFQESRAKGRAIWQRRYWEHTIRDENDFARHIDYIHINPVKQGLVTRAGDCPYSSFQPHGEAWSPAGGLGRATSTLI